MAVRYPVGVARGDLVRLLREIRTRGGAVFAKGEVLEVGECVCSARGRRGHPRVSLWDPKKREWNPETDEAARGVMKVEREDYVVVEKRK